jgi:ribosomal protein L36
MGVERDIETEEIIARSRRVAVYCAETQRHSNRYNGWEELR